MNTCVYLTGPVGAVSVTAPRHDNDEQGEGLYRGELSPLQRSPRYSLGFSVLVVIVITVAGWGGAAYVLSLLL